MREQETTDDGESNRRESGSTRRTILAGTVASGLASLGGGAGTVVAKDGGNATEGGNEPCLTLTSPAFENRGEIPAQYTCDGENVSPALRISGVPAAGEALALVVDDPDAPREVPFTHWLLWNVPPDTREITRSVPTVEVVEALGGAAQGTNDAGELGYTGPCPPEGTHSYRFQLYVLASPLDLEAGAERQAVVRAVADEALAVALLTGEYSRSGGGTGAGNESDG